MIFLLCNDKIGTLKGDSLFVRRVVGDDTVGWWFYVRQIPKNLGCMNFVLLVISVTFDLVQETHNTKYR